MDSTELRNLHEAYLDVYAPQEVGEEMKPLPKNKMFRKAGNLGRDIVSPATGDEDRQKKYGRQKKIIRQLNKANEQLEESGLSQDTIRSAAKERQKRVDTAYAKDTPQGDAEGNAGMKKLARTKGQLNINKPREVRMRANEEFDIFDAILEYLVTEGYADTNESALVIMANMSEEWREDIVEATATPPSKFNIRRGLDAKSRRLRRSSDFYAYGQDPDPEERKISTSKGEGGITKNPKKLRKQKAMGEIGESYDLYDIILSHLIAEGYAETLEKAEWMMANVIDEEAIDIILGEEQLDELSVNKMLAYVEKGEKNRADLNKKWDKGTATHREKMRVLGREEGEARASDKVEKKTGKRPYEMNALDKARYAVTKEDYMDEAQVANRDPDKYEAGQQKKSAPVRGERTPMPPRGDKRREDFEKWYAANVR